MVDILLALFMTSAPAHAGDTLYLKSGKVAVDDSMKNFEWERDRRRRKDLLRGDKKNHLFIVQFRSTITETDRQDLETLKARVLGYVPDDAYVVEATGVVAQTIRLSSTRVRDVLKYDADWKISPELKDLDEATTVQVSSCTGEITEAKVRTAADLDRIAGREQTLWIALVDESDDAAVTDSDDAFDDVAAVEAPHRKHKHKNESARKIVGRLIQSQLLNGAEAQAEVPAHAVAEEPESDGLTVGNEKGIAVGETDTYPLAVRRSSHVRVTLEYDDAQAAKCADTDLVNELSISVKDNKGHEHAASGPDGVIDFVAPSGGYDLHVRGENVPTALLGRQPYTLHVSVE